MNRRKYVRAMLKAINKARQNHFEGESASKTDGLRVIRRFEKVNKIKFDPFNSLHIDAISGWGKYEGFFRAIKNL